MNERHPGMLFDSSNMLTRSQTKQYYDIVLDVETTGLPVFPQRRGSYHDPTLTHYYDSARLIQICWYILNANGTIVQTRNHFIHHPGIRVKNTHIHGITQDHLDTHGISFSTSCKLLESDLELRSMRFLVGHHIAFDVHILLSECVRAGQLPLFQRIQAMQRYCTMKQSTPLLQLPLPSPIHLYKDGYKYPSLRELYCYFFIDFPYRQHDAEEDVKATVACFLKLLDVTIPSDSLSTTTIEKVKN